MPDASQALYGVPGPDVNTYEIAFFGDSIPVLVCGCGEAGCAAVTAEITTTKTTLEWTNISRYRPEGTGQPFRTVGPFRFRHSEYDAALKPVAGEPFTDA